MFDLVVHTLADTLFTYFKSLVQGQDVEQMYRKNAKGVGKGGAPRAETRLYMLLNFQSDKY